MAKILVVEDNELNFMLIVEILADYNFEIIHADSGKQFFKAINEDQSFNLVLMDISLPDTNGIILSKHIIDEHLNIPVIICSAYNTKDIINEVNKLGIEHFIEKPIDITQLFDSMGKFVEIK